MIARRRRDRLGTDVREALQRFSALGERELDDEAFFAELARTIAETVRSEKAAVAILHGDELRVRGSCGFPPEVVATMAVRVDTSHPGLAERRLFGDSVLVGDLRRSAEELEPFRDLLNSMGVHDAVAVGWRGGGSPLGTIAAFDSTRPDGFAPRDALLLELAAEVSSFVFRQRRERQRAQTLLRLGDELARSPDFRTMADVTAEAARLIFPGVECAIVEVPVGRPQEFRAVVAPEGVAGEIPPEADQAGTGAALVIASGEPLETDQLEKFSVHGTALVNAGYLRVRCVPVGAGQPLPDGRAALGAISFLSRSSEPFTTEDRNLMDDLARRLGVVAHRGELLRQATEASTGFRAALDAAIDIGSSLDPPQVIARLLKRATDALGSDRATLSSIDGDDLVIRGSYAVDGRAFEVGQRFRYAMSPQFLELLKTRQPLHERYRVEDLEADVRPAMEGFQHAITIPIVEEDRVVATLTVSRRSDRSFSHSDTRLLELVGAAAGIALQNASLFEETARSRRSLQLALEAAEDVAAATDIGDVVAKLLRRACAAANATEAALGHLEGDEVVVDQASDSRGLGLRWPIGPDTKEALARGRPAQISNPRALAPSSEHAASTSSDWALSVPLVLEGEVVGMLGLGRRQSAFTEDEIDAVRRLSPVAALLVRNARLLEEAREASRAKSEFLNMAGHELRTPLAIVRGYLSLIATGVYGETPAEWASVLMLLEDKSRELSVMVESILTAARLQSGRLQTSRERVDLVAIVQRTVERATAAAALSGGAVVGRYPHEPIYVEGDPTQLSVIVDNLLANAVKYSSPPAAVTAAVQYRDGAAEVRIADRGRGIPPEHKDRIFEEFVRIDNLDRDYPPGTGLGLYIARQLAERYGGSLELEWSEPGRGSTFVLRLPALESPVSPA